MGATAIDHVGVFVVAVVDACMSFWCVVVAVWVFLVCVCVFFVLVCVCGGSFFVPKALQVLYSLSVIIVYETPKLPVTLKYKVYMFYISYTYQSTDEKKCCKYFGPEGVLKLIDEFYSWSCAT